MPNFVPTLFSCCKTQKEGQPKAKKLTSQEKQKQQVDLLRSILTQVLNKTSFLDSEAWHATQRMVQVDLFGFSNRMGWHVDLAFNDHAAADEIINIITPYFAPYVNDNNQNLQMKEQEKLYLATHMAHRILCSLFERLFTKPNELSQTQTFSQETLDEYRKKFWLNLDEKSIRHIDVEVTNQTYEKSIIDTIKRIGPQRLFEEAYNDWHEVEVTIIEQMESQKRKQSAIEEDMAQNEKRLTLR